MRKYVTYRRVSSTEQGKSGLGLEAQARDIQLFLDNYAESPYEVVGDFVETHTGSDNDRPQLNAAIALARKTGAVLVVAKLDRLSRRVSFLAALMEEKGWISKSPRCLMQTGFNCTSMQHWRSRKERLSPKGLLLPFKQRRQEESVLEHPSTT